MGVYSEMAADLRDNVQDRSPAIQDAAELASRRADDRQQAEEEQAKALLSQMQQNADDSPSPSNLKADKKAEEDRKRQEHCRRIPVLRTHEQLHEIIHLYHLPQRFSGARPCDDRTWPQLHR